MGSGLESLRRHYDISSRYKDVSLKGSGWIPDGVIGYRVSLKPLASQASIRDSAPCQGFRLWPPSRRARTLELRGIMVNSPRKSHCRTLGTSQIRHQLSERRAGSRRRVLGTESVMWPELTSLLSLQSYVITSLREWPVRIRVGCVVPWCRGPEETMAGRNTCWYDFISRRSCCLLVGT